MTNIEKDILLKDICCRIPYNPEGILDTVGIVNLVEINLSKPEMPLFLVKVNGKTVECSIDLFKPILRPISDIYEEIKPGLIPWLEYHKRWYRERLEDKNLILVYTEYKFEKDNSPHSKWKWFEGKYGKGSTECCCATFKDGLAFQVGYELGIDVSGLIEKGLAVSYEDKDSILYG